MKSSSFANVVLDGPLQDIHSSSDRSNHGTSHHHRNNELVELQNIKREGDEIDISVAQYEVDDGQDNVNEVKSENVDNPLTSETYGIASQNNQNTELRRRRQSTGHFSHRAVEDTTTSAMYGSELNPNTIPDGGKQANLVLFGSFMGLIADFGIPNSLGAIESYVSTNQLRGVSKADIGWVFSLHLCVMYLGGVFFGEVFDRYGARKPLIAGTILMCAGLFCTAECQELYQFILSFAILTALGTSLAMSPLIGVLSHWFLKKRALASLIATIGGLLGASCFSIMLQQLYDKIGFKNAIRVLACICFGCMLVSICLVKERRGMMGQEGVQAEEEGGMDGRGGDFEMGSLSALRNTTEDVYREGIVADQVEEEEGEEGEEEHGGDVVELESGEQNERKKTKGGDKDAQEPVWSKVGHFFKETLDVSIWKAKRFILLTLAVFLAEVVSMTTLTYLGSYALVHDVDERSSYLLLTIINVCGIPSRLLSGMIADKYGRFNVMIVTSILTTIFIFALWYPAQHVTLLYVFGIFFGISTSAVLALIPACAGQICSLEQFGKVYGNIYFFLGWLTLLGMYFASLIIGNGSKSNYSAFVLFEGGLSTMSIIMWVFARSTSVGWRWSKF